MVAEESYENKLIPLGTKSANHGTTIILELPPLSRKTNLRFNVITSK